MMKDLETIMKKYYLWQIWTNLDNYLEEGIPIDDIIELGEPYDGCFVEHCTYLLDNDADANRLFEKTKDWLKPKLADYPMEVAETLEEYVEHGVNKETAKAWLEANIRDEDFIKHAEYFADFGIDVTGNHVTAYFASKEFLDAWEGVIYYKTPNGVTAEDVVNYYGIAEIWKTITQKYPEGAILSGRHYDFPSFIIDYAEEGADIDLLAEKVLEYFDGYPEDEEKLFALATLVENGSEKVDPNKIINSLTYSAFKKKDWESMQEVKRLFYITLKDYADDAHLIRIAP